MNLCVNPASGIGPSSAHAGSVNVVYADGSVETLHDGLSQEILSALITSNGGETLQHASGRNRDGFDWEKWGE